MYIYIATSALFRSNFLFKIGCTSSPKNRLISYKTSFPPGFNPSCEIYYELIFKTDAQTIEKLYNYEKIIHNQFIKFRLMYNQPFDTEWFKFANDAEFKLIEEYIIKTFNFEKITLDQTSYKKYLNKHFCHNTNIVNDNNDRLNLLNNLQDIAQEKIKKFIASFDYAGYLLAPCGSGKTVMTVKSIIEINKVIICCPSNQIQRQWKDTILNYKIFEENEIILIGNDGKTDEEFIYDLNELNKFCIISTYQSSDLLLNIIPNLIIMDEAHHCVGKVALSEDGEGKTRKFIHNAFKCNYKRLFLTFTPKYSDLDESEYIIKWEKSDSEMFGNLIHEFKLRELIDLGILPDYRIWTLYTETTGFYSNAMAIIEAFNATRIEKECELFILNHLIVFCETNESAREYNRIFKENGLNSIHVKGGDDINAAIREFSNYNRAIFVNCKVLSEGVDIPIADSVVITYTKFSRCEITQMLLRPGRWYENKSLFHILLILNTDLEPIREILYTLASIDTNIKNEIIKKSCSSGSSVSSSQLIYGKYPEHILIDQFDNVIECFQSIKKMLFTSKDSREIQKSCLELNLDTSIDYKKLKNLDWPDNPCKTATWYDYLHPLTEKIKYDNFVTFIQENKISNLHEYEAYDKSPFYVKLQYISDGYFIEITNLSTIFYKSVYRGKR